MAATPRKSVQLNDAISGDRAEQLASDLLHQKSRVAISSVVEDYVGSSKFAERMEEIIVKHTDTVPFMEKSQKYADQQIDKRLFKNAKVVLGLVIGWVASIAVAVLVTRLTN